MALNRVGMLWKESIAFFSWETLRLFLFGVVNNAYHTIIGGIYYFWWLFIIVGFARVTSAEWLENVAQLLLYFFLMMIARPSVERKDMHYFFTYLYKLPGYVGLCFIFYLGWFLVNITITTCCSPFAITDTLSSGIMLFLSVLIPRLSMLAFLFYVDLPTTVNNVLKAAYNSLLFFLYFLPVMVVFVLAEALLLSLPQILSYVITWQSCNSHLLNIVSLLPLGVMRLIALSMVTMYYVKVRYQHIKLFFK